MFLILFTIPWGHGSSTDSSTTPRINHFMLPLLVATEAMRWASIHQVTEFKRCKRHEVQVLMRRRCRRCYRRVSYVQLNSMRCVTNAISRVHHPRIPLLLFLSLRARVLSKCFTLLFTLASPMGLPCFLSPTTSPPHF